MPAAPVVIWLAELSSHHENQTLSFPYTAHTQSSQDGKMPPADDKVLLWTTIGWGTSIKKKISEQRMYYSEQNKNLSSHIKNPFPKIKLGNNPIWYFARRRPHAKTSARLKSCVNQIRLLQEEHDCDHADHHKLLSAIRGSWKKHWAS